MGAVMLIADRVDNRARNVIRDKERHCTMTKETITQEDITVHVHMPNSRAANSMRQKQKNLQREIDEFTIIFRDYNAPLFQMNSSSRQTFRKEDIIVLKLYTINQLDLIEVYGL